MGTSEIAANDNQPSPELHRLRRRYGSGRAEKLLRRLQRETGIY